MIHSLIYCHLNRSDPEQIGLKCLHEHLSDTFIQNDLQLLMSINYIKQLQVKWQHEA